MKRVSINVSGKVQGVFFRASAKEKADELQISGHARNNEDGSVSIEAEGEDDSIRQFVAWCHKGPRLSIVEHCDVEDRHLENTKGFFILR